MAVSTLEAKAHELLGQLDPSKLAAVVHLLEVMVHDDEGEGLTEEDRLSVAASREYFRQGGQGLSFEQVVDECGFTIDRILGTKRDS